MKYALRSLVVVMIFATAGLFAQAATEAPAAGDDASGVVISFYPDGTADAGDITLRDRAGFRRAVVGQQANLAGWQLDIQHVWVRQ